MPDTGRSWSPREGVVLARDEHGDLDLEAVWAAGPPIRDAETLRAEAEVPLPPEGQAAFLHDEKARREAEVQDGKVDPAEGIIVAEENDPYANALAVDHVRRKQAMEIAEVINRPLMQQALRLQKAIDRAKEYIENEQRVRGAVATEWVKLRLRVLKAKWANR